jgi:hypothetical protein
MTKGASMKRAIAFLLFGPALAAVTVMLVMAQVARPTYDLEKIVAVAVFFFSLPVAALAGCLDAYLARAFAIPLRAPLIAAAGAVISSGLAYILFNWFFPSPSFLAFFAIGGAACAGLCSLLANEYGGHQPAVYANSLLRH